MPKQKNKNINFVIIRKSECTKSLLPFFSPEKEEGFLCKDFATKLTAGLVEGVRRNRLTKLAELHKKGSL